MITGRDRYGNHKSPFDLLSISEQPDPNCLTCSGRGWTHSAGCTSAIYHKCHCVKNTAYIFKEQPMALTYRLISKTVEAVQYRSNNTLSSYPDWIIEALMKREPIVGSLRMKVDGDMALRVSVGDNGSLWLIKPTHWIICCDGHLTVMSDEAFKSTYEITTEQPS